MGAETFRTQDYNTNFITTLSNKELLCNFVHMRDRSLFKDPLKILLYFIVFLKGQREENFRKNEVTGNFRKDEGT
jgi:hypothetical protein